MALSDEADAGAPWRRRRLDRRPASAGRPPGRLRRSRSVSSPMTAWSRSGATCCGMPRFLPRAKRLRGAVRLTDDGASLVLEGGSHWPTRRGIRRSGTGAPTIWWEAAGGARRRLLRRPAEPKPSRRRRCASSRRMRRSSRSTPLRRRCSTITWFRVVLTPHAGEVSSMRTRALERRRSRLPTAGSRVTAIELDAAAARWVAAHLPPARAPSRRVSRMRCRAASGRRRDSQSAPRGCR